MAIAVRGTYTGSSTGNVTIPTTGWTGSNPVAGDIIVIWQSLNDISSLLTATPSGFTNVANYPSTNYLSAELDVGTFASSSITVNNGTGGSGILVVTAVALSGATTTLDGSASVSGLVSTTGSNVTPPTVTLTAATSAVLTFVGQAGATASVTWTDPSTPVGITAEGALKSAGSGSDYAGAAAYYYLPGSSGTVTTGAATGFTAGTFDRIAGVVALKASASGTATSGSATITLSASVVDVPKTATTGASTITLSASAVDVPQTASTGTSTITLAASVVNGFQTATTGAATITLTGTAVPTIATSGSATITLSASVVDVPQTATTGAATITLTGTAVTTIATSGTSSITLGAAAVNSYYAAFTATTGSTHITLSALAGVTAWYSSVDLKFSTTIPFDRRWTFTAAPSNWSTALVPLAPHWTFTKAV